jgi:TnpA family transposase
MLVSPQHKLLHGQINTKIIQENYDDVLRLAHSIREGTVSASLIKGKIGSFARQNSLATALRERALQDQLQRASALNILINAISVWNTIHNVRLNNRSLKYCISKIMCILTFNYGLSL